MGRASQRRNNQGYGMRDRENLTLLISGIVLVLATLVVITLEPLMTPPSTSTTTPSVSGLLTDPFLQLPTEDSVRVVWFTEFKGRSHRVVYAIKPTLALTEGNIQQVVANTRRMSRLREDKESRLPTGDPPELPTAREVWRHEAEIKGLTPGVRIPYQVVSQREDSTLVSSDLFTLTPAPAAGQALRILLTSDHQQMPLTATNLQKVEETFGLVDAVFLAGDLVNIPDRASEWFDDARGAAFFAALQGRGAYTLGEGNRAQTYRGGRLLQYAPLFPAAGNHEVMGRVSAIAPLGVQFNDPVPRQAAVDPYHTKANFFNPSGDLGLRRQWIIDHSFNIDTYEELFTLPQTVVPNPAGAETTSRYYATTFGDVRLISLFVTNIWRRPDVQPDVQGRFQERLEDLANPAAWGHGQHIFEPITPGSFQSTWLQQELNSEAFRQAKYKIVMFHHPPHSLGDNVVPPFTDPRPMYDLTPDGRLAAIRYEYPLSEDYIIRDLIPLLEAAGVDLVLYGHSHLWNRFVSPTGMHFLETSNVGNTYGAFWGGKTRTVPPVEGTKEFGKFQGQYYAAQGDPNGLEPVVPTLAPLLDDTGNPLPYLSSNEITAFSILETETGTVSSYYFDTRKPRSPVVKFDEFTLGRAQPVG